MWDQLYILNVERRMDNVLFASGLDLVINLFREAPGLNFSKFKISFSPEHKLVSWTKDHPKGNESYPSFSQALNDYTKQELENITRDYYVLIGTDLTIDRKIS